MLHLIKTKEMKIARILTIAGSDSGGGAGIQADLKTITVLGGFGMSAITAITAQNTLGVHGIFDIPPEFVARQIDVVAHDIGIDAAKTGMLAQRDILQVVIDKIYEHRITKLVVDPVMVAKGETPLVRGDVIGALKTRLIPLAYIITPNIPEAEVLTGKTIKTKEEMKESARHIHQMGAKYVIVKGGHMKGDALDVFFDGQNFYEFHATRIDTPNTHGTGCTFSAALATALGQGKDVLEAVTLAKNYITEAIRYSLNLGAGHGPTNHLAPIIDEQKT